MKNDILKRILKALINSKDSFISIIKTVDWKGKLNSFLLKAKILVKHLFLSAKISLAFLGKLVFDFEESEIKMIHNYHKSLYSQIRKK